MHYCKKCHYPSNHALGITFNAEGLCSGCIIHEEKDQIDWDARKTELRAILEDYKNDSSTARHDCIIPVSGGKDSFFIVDLIKNEFGLNPLLVAYNRFYNTRAGVYNLERIRTEIGCDIVTMTPNPRVLAKLIHYSLDKLGSIHWPFLAGSTVFPVQMAVTKNIPLIIWGAHQGVDQVGMFSHDDRVEMTRRYRREHDLLGIEAEDILEDAEGCKKHNLNYSDLSPLFYPEDTDLYSTGVRGIYLNNFMRWDTKAQHEKMFEKYSYYTGPQLRTFDTYNDIDCRIYSSLHDEIKFRKLGYSKINDHVAREIRFNRITPQEGLDLIAAYQQKPLPDFKWFFDWIGLGKDTFWAHIDAHRDPRAWQKTGKNWALRDPLNIPTKQNTVQNILNFKTNSPEEVKESPEDKRILMRGGAWV